ncbi:hypothetical protein TWF718_010448 [Orbilia javanica]|uniref:Uncharacterized protein n=1 Tax=Orbilia javanica TaxID=47235 RepID=A0AAN8RE94_9PEZI
MRHKAPRIEDSTGLEARFEATCIAHSEIGVLQAMSFDNEFVGAARHLSFALRSAEGFSTPESLKALVMRKWLF